jgi:predicted type IV restriction endonuclease
MLDLNLPKYDFKVKIENGKKQIFDSVRKRFVVLTPEEWVRQHFIQFLHRQKGFPLSLMGIEFSLQYNGMQKRADIICFKTDGKPFLLVECKSFSISIQQKVFDQIARYNFDLQVPYLVVTNGIDHFCCALNEQKKTYEFIEEIPSF